MIVRCQADRYLDTPDLNSDTLTFVFYWCAKEPRIHLTGHVLGPGLSLPIFDAASWLETE